MRINELQANLKKNISPIYLVLGTEMKLIDKAHKEFLNLLSPEEKDMNFAEYDLLQTNIADVIGDANSMPFFGDKRLIFVDDPYFLTGNRVKTGVDQNIDSFEDYLNHPQPSTIFVIFAPYDKLDNRKKITKKLQKVAATVNVGKLSFGEMRNELMQQVQDDGYQIEPDALVQLIDRTHGDYSQASSQLNKLYLYAIKTKKITKQAVAGLVPQTLDNNVFDLIEMILKGDLDKSEQLYQQLLLLKTDPTQLTAISISQIRLLLQVKILTNKGMSQGKLASYLKVHPYRVKLAIGKSHQYSYQMLKKALTNLINIDYQMKTGQGDKEKLFDLFIINFIQNKKTA